MFVQNKDPNNRTLNAGSRRESRKAETKAGRSGALRRRGSQLRGFRLGGGGGGGDGISALGDSRGFWISGTHTRTAFGFRSRVLGGILA